MQKYGAMANNAVDAPFECQVCGSTPASFNWSDLHGQGMCSKCGTPYQLVQYEGEGDDRKRIDAPPAISIKPSWIPVLETYWNETHAYMGLGTIMIWRDYPECEEGQRKFYAWCDEHKDLLPPKEEETAA